MSRSVTQEQLEALIKVFRGARDRLLQTIIQPHGVGTKVYANAILQQLEKQLARMEKQSAYYVKSVIPAEYREAAGSVYRYFQKNGLRMKSPEHFALIHNDAIYALAREMQYQIGQGLEQVGRQIQRYVGAAQDNALRRAGLEAAAEKMASGATVRQMRDNLIGKLQSEGFFSVQYGEGDSAYQVGLDSYASMVARSTTREAGNLARENQLAENGYDLMKMSEHYPTCAVCAQLQGRVYSISGKDPRFPPLSKAFPSGYRNVHPHCRHVMTYYIEEWEDVAADAERSNRPFTDNRGQDEINLYNRQQANGRRLRQDIYQYERYKMRLGDHAPKSFGAFRRMKNAGGKSWGVLEAQYKGIGYYSKATTAEPAVTKTVTEIAEKTGMQPAGLEYRIKSQESYLRKIRDNYNPDGTKYEVKDILRYTYTAPGEELAEKTVQSIDAFHESGYNTIEVKNTWHVPRAPYRGINTNLKSPSGQIFEMQYHTPESFELKNGRLHKLYEEWRVLDRSSPKAIEIYNKMVDLSAALPVPPNIEKVR